MGALTSGWYSTEWNYLMAYLFAGTSSLINASLNGRNLAIGQQYLIDDLVSSLYAKYFTAAHEV